MAEPEFKFSKSLFNLNHKTTYSADIEKKNNNVIFEYVKITIGDPF